MAWSWLKKIVVAGVIIPAAVTPAIAGCCGGHAPPIVSSTTTTNSVTTTSMTQVVESMANLQLPTVPLSFTEGGGGSPNDEVM